MGEREATTGDGGEAGGAEEEAGEAGEEEVEGQQGWEASREWWAIPRRSRGRGRGMDLLPVAPKEEGRAGMETTEGSRQQGVAAA